MVVASPNIKKYFNDIEISVNKAYTIAKEARSKGLDPEKTTAIPVAKNMAERVVGLISVVAPQIVDSTVTKRIIELEKKYGQLDWRVGFVIAEEVAKEIFCKFKDRQEAMEIGIRIGFAYLTLGIVSAPLEGFIGLKIKKRRDGKEYFALQYAGPIRAAGGTASSTSVILSDYVRIKLGYAPYDPEDIEINRYTTEIHDYHDRVTNLQYHPSDEELKFMISHLPVEVDGDPTEKFEVSNYKDLPRIETNLIRGGVALVIAEGLTQKAPKLWKRISKWGKEMGLEWGWLEEFIKLKEKIHASHSNKKNEDKTEKKTVKANNTFIMDLVAGRPILTHPLREGGFRLRYGRCRTSGFSAAAVNPATLTVLNKYIAIGTQLKIERPGKAATITLCDTIDGPIVRLEDGTVMALNTEKEAKLVVKQIEEIIFLGDFLFNYGDFSENGHSLVPVGYCPEWWSLEVEKATPNKEIIEKIFIQKPLRNSPSFEEAVDISKKFKVPLHPDFTFHWKLVNKESLENLIIWLKECKIKKDGKNITKIILPFHKNIEKYVKGKKVLEFLGVPHQLINTENIVIEKEIAQSLALSLNFDTEAEIKELQKKINKTKETNGLKIINFLSEVKLRDKSGTFIGARMGRPEKSKMRHLTGSPQVMFPVGEEGDRLRSFQSALEKGKIRSTFPTFYCKDCDSKTIYISCEICKKECIKLYNCRFCGDLEKKTCRHGDGFPFKTYDLDVRRFFNNAKKVINANIVPDLIKGVRGTSNKEHVVEHLAKGLLRAKHEIYVNKDGTTRYDCTELPLTHFKPKEIKTSIKKLKELGYDTDIEGKNLENENQLLELKPQDIIIPGHDSLGDSGPEVMKKVANFIDDLLVNFYGLKPFYNIKSFDDLAGHLVIGLAPHISAGMVGRIIGFSETQGLLTSPMYHAGMRRDCVHPNTEFVYNCDGKLKKEKIGKFTEKIIKNGTKLQKVDSFGTLKIKCDKEYYVYGINPLTNKLKLKKVKFFLKAPKPEKWVRIKTKTSRKFIMTPTHDFMHVIKKKLVLKKAKFAKEGDLIPLLNLRKNKDQTKKKIYALTFNKKLFNKTYFSLEGKEDLLYDEIVKVDFIEDKKNAYCLEIEYNSDADKNILWGEQIINTRCDGDEACVMLLMDALLNFSRQYLPERRGAKSITPDTLIYYKKNNKIKTEKIGSLVDSLLILHQDKVCYDTDYEILELAGYQAISFDAQTQKTNFYPITKFIRHNSPKIIYEIKSSHGKIKTTGDHSIFVTTGKKIVKKEVRNLKEGEFIVTLGKINLPTKKFKKLDLCKIAKDIIYVKLNKDYSKKVKLLSKKKKTINKKMEK
jgi:DNA polymerase II large subunit